MVIQKGLKNLSHIWFREHTEALFIFFPLVFIFIIYRQTSNLLNHLVFFPIRCALKWWITMNIQFLTPEKWFTFVFQIFIWQGYFIFHNFKTWGREDNPSLLLYIWSVCPRFLGRIINESRKCFIFAFYYFVFIVDFLY